MSKKHGRAFLKYCSAALLAAFVSYSQRSSISYAVNTTRFYNAAGEQGYVSKDQSFKLRITREISKSSNLETYLQLGDVKYPILARQEGFILGDALHSWLNFTDEEKRQAITSELQDKEKLEKILENGAMVYALQNISKAKRDEVIKGLMVSTSHDDMLSMLEIIDYETLWQAIPREKKKEIIVANIRDSARRGMDEIKNALKGFWGDFYVF